MHIIHHKLILEIEQYLSATGMARSAFGKLALNDFGLVADLKNGRELRRENERRVRSFMESNPPSTTSTTHNTPSGSRQHSQKLGAAE
jgi:hypothetical protein